MKHSEKEEIPEIEKPNDEFMTTKIRGICREGFEMAAPSLVAIAKGEAPNTSPAVQIRAIDTLGKYGLGRHPDILLNRGEWLSVVAEVTAQHLGDLEKYEAWSAQVLSALKFGQ